MHSMAFICHVFHGKDLSLHVKEKMLSNHYVMRSIYILKYKYIYLKPKVTLHFYLLIYIVTVFFCFFLTEQKMLQ